MARSCFTIKVISTVALLYFSFNIGFYTAEALCFWCGLSEDSDYQDSDFEDLDTEHFPLPEKCPTPPPYEPPPPYDDN